MDSWTIFLFIFLVIASAFFSSSEIGIMSIPRHLIDLLVKKGNKRAAQLMWLKDRTDKLLITILIWNNLVNTLIAALATKIAIDIGRTSGFEEWLAVGAATIIITIVLLLFGEILPKTMATRVALPFGLAIAPIHIFLIRISKPFIWIVEKFINIFDKTNNHIRKVSQEEIEVLVDIAWKQGTIDKTLGRHIKKIMSFHESTAEEIMTPRVAIEALSTHHTIDQSLELLKGFSHTRIPVYWSKIDDIKRIISEKELLINKQENNGDKELKDIGLQKALKIPLTMPLDKIIEVFKKERRQIAIVMDEYGGVSWLITLEDLIEEIFGEFIDETDKELIPIKNDWESYIVQGSVLIDDLIEKAHLDRNNLGLSEQKYSGETISYIVTSELERFPEENEEILFYNKTNTQEHEDFISALSVVVTKRDENSIQEVHVRAKNIEKWIKVL